MNKTFNIKPEVNIKDLKGLPIFRHESTNGMLFYHKSIGSMPQECMVMLNKGEHTIVVTNYDKKIWDTLYSKHLNKFIQRDLFNSQDLGM